MQELNKETQTWDDKFGIIEKPKCGFQTEKGECGYEMPDCMRDCIHIGDEASCIGYVPNISNLTAYEHKVVLDGVGKDAEIITNAAGGKQSKSPMAMHLVDPYYLEDMFKDLAEKLEYLDEGDSTCVDAGDIDRHGCCRAIECIAAYMRSGVDFELTVAMDSLCDDELEQVTRIAKVLQYGADRYEPNNWRLIPEEEHINHALIHIIAHLMGDTQDEHIDHALCRLMMAKETEKSDGFAYGKYVKMNEI